MADKQKNIEICCPHVSILGVSTPETMYGNALTMESLADGLMSRFMIFDTGSNVPPLVQVARTEVPDSICQQLRKWIEFEPSGDMGWKLSPKPLLVTTSPEAMIAFQRAIIGWDITADRLPPESGPSAYRRLGEHARKYALVWACSEKEPSDEIVIEKRHADWSIALVSWLMARSLQIVKTRVVSSQRERDMNQLLEFIQSRSRNGQQTTMRDIIRKFRKWDAKYRNELVNGLAEAGDLCIREVSTGKRPTTFIELQGSEEC